MLRENFIYRIFKDKKNKNNEIIKYNLDRNFNLRDEINNEINQINQQISENTKALFEAQIVKIRSSFSKSNNFIEKIGKNIYKTKLEDSISWHQNQLKDLYLRRRKLQITLEKLKGTFWINNIKRFLIIILVGSFILLSLFIFLSGFMIIIYLLPLILLIFIGYFLANKKY
tara:strand:+ start:24 stop:536 length:513 start_codon:yes stop_codon:yes gene_type:complete